MKRGLVFIGFFSLLMVSFQNCSQHNFATQQSVGESTTALSKSAGVQPATDFTQLTLWDNQNQQILDVNLTNGEMVAFEDYGSVRGAKFCLTADELTEVKTILANSSVCVPDIDLKNAKDQICTMLYQYPYASLSNAKDEIKLGERTSGCDQPSDLCDDKGAMLKNFSASVLKNLEQRKCL